MILEEKIIVMVGAWAGEPVQSKFRSTSGLDVSWSDVSNPKWDWSRFDYRLKTKEPKEPKEPEEPKKLPRVHVYEDCAGHLSFATDKSTDHEYIRDNLEDFKALGSFDLKDLVTSSV